MTQRSMLLAAICGSCFLISQPAPVQAQEVSLDGYQLFGFSGQNNQLVRYQFNQALYESLGPVRLSSGATLTGIEGLAYIPGHLNIMGFWTSPADNLTRLVYINCETAEAGVADTDLGPGQVTGATVSWKDQDQQLDTGGVDIAGDININPNNSTANEFVLKMTDGTIITRDMLHQSTAVNSAGAHVTGPAYYLRVKPMGGGVQGDLTAGGEAYDITNDNAYVLSGGTMTVSVYNDFIDANGKAMGHWWVHISDSGSAVMHEAGDTYGYTGVFALQSVEAQEDDVVDFDIVGKDVIPSEAFAAKVTVLGAAISAGGSYDLPVTVQTKVGNTIAEPFGDFTKPVGGNVNDNLNPRRHVFPAIYPAGTPITIAGRSWLKKKWWYSGNNNHHWWAYMTVNSMDNSPQVLVLRNGDTVPNIEPFLNQADILDFIRDYVQNGVVVLDENQVIYLYELGTTNLNSAAADFQDLVVLVTLAKDPADLVNEDDDDDGTAGLASRLIKVDQTTGGFEQIMTLDRVYDGLTASDNGLFYATHGQQLYKLDPFEQTETPVGTMSHSGMKGLEKAGATFCGFTVVQDKLVPIDVLTGQSIGTPMSILATDLRAIVFMDNHEVPSSNAAFD